MIDLLSCSLDMMKEDFLPFLCLILLLFHSPLPAKIILVHPKYEIIFCEQCNYNFFQYYDSNNKSNFIIDQQIAEHFVHYSGCLYHPPPLLCNLNN